MKHSCLLAALVPVALTAACKSPSQGGDPVGDSLGDTHQSTATQEGASSKIEVTVERGSAADVERHAQGSGRGLFDDLEPDGGPHEFASPDGGVTLTLAHYADRGWTLDARSGNSTFSMLASATAIEARARRQTEAGAESSPDDRDTRETNRITHRLGDWYLSVEPLTGDWETARDRDEFDVSFVQAPVHDAAVASAAQPAVLRDEALNGPPLHVVGADSIVPRFTFASPDGVIELTFSRTAKQTWFIAGTTYRDDRLVDVYMKPIPDRLVSKITDEGRLSDVFDGYSFSIYPTDGDWAAAREGADFTVLFTPPSQGD